MNIAKEIAAVSSQGSQTMCDNVKEALHGLLYAIQANDQETLNLLRY